jgi:hypothetical protein
MSKSTALTVTRSAAVPAIRTETKAEKFRRLANNRTTEALDTIERIGNLAGPSYEYTEDQVAALEKALRDGLKTAFDKLRTRTAKAPPRRSII